jgi:hypothetical protein
MRSAVQPGIAAAMRALLTARRGTKEPTPRNFTLFIAVQLSPPRDDDQACREGRPGANGQR